MRYISIHAEEQMRKSYGSRNARRVCQAVLAAAAAMAVVQSGYAQTVTLAGFEGTNEFNELGNAAQYTFTPGATIGVTQGASSLKVDMLTTVPSGDPLTLQFSNLGVDYEDRGAILVRNKFSFDVTVPAGQSTGTPVDLEFSVFMQGNNQPNWGGWAGIGSPAFSVPEGSDKMTLTFDLTASKGAFNGIVNNSWWQTVIQARNAGENRTFYLDNFRAWGVDSTANGEWKNPAGGNWGTATNWNPETVPLNLDSTALLGTFGGTITGSPAINMDSSPTLKTLTLNTPSGQGYTLSGSGAISIDASTNDGSIHVLSGQHTIAVPLTMADNTAGGGAVIEVAAGAQLTATNFNAQYLDIAKDGDGTLIINKIADVGLNIRGGTLKLTADATGGPYGVSLANAGTTLDINGHYFICQYNFGGADGSTINLGNNGSIDFTQGGGVISSNIVGSGQLNLVKSGANLTLQGTASTFTGPININNATLTVNNGGALGNASNVVNLTDSALAATGSVFGYGHTIAISGSGTVDTQTHAVYMGIVSGGGLTKMGTGTLNVFKVDTSGQTLMVAGGVLQLGLNGGNDATSRFANVTLDDGMGGQGAFDVTNNRVVLEAADVNAVRSQILTGYNAGAWNGLGIVTSSATNTAALGYADASSIGMVGNSFGGFTVNAGNVLLAFTLRGDSNLDRTVNSVDFGYFAAAYGLTAGAQWRQGDYNYDQKVNSEDFNYLAGNFGQTLTLPPPAPLGAVVPEPSTVLLLAGPVLLAGLSRKRRSR